MNAYTKENKSNIHFFDVILCPYEDQTLAFFMKLAFTFIWAISIPNGLLYGASTDYIIALAVMVAALILNILFCHICYRRWIDFITFFILYLPVFYVFFHANIGNYLILN